MPECQHCGKEHAEELRFCPNTGRVISPERLYPVGTLLEGKYQIGKPLGVGGMGAVFEGTHTLLDKRVAIKVLLPEFAKDKEMSARLMREARAASATGHRNIVAVTDMGYTHDGSLFMVMEHVSGRTLKQVIDEEAPLMVTRSCRLTCQILAALEVVHKKGIIHRDLKPNNIIDLIDDEGEEIVKILDFGISKVSDDPSLTDLTTLGKVMGTPKYMAPEQAVGESSLDHRADLYASGAMLYEMLTGRAPHVADNYNAMIAMLLQGKITPPADLNRAVPQALSLIVMKALARRPEERIPEASAFRRALKPFCEESSEETKPGLGLDEVKAVLDRPVAIQLAPPGAVFSDEARFRSGQPADDIERLVETASSPGTSQVGSPAPATRSPEPSPLPAAGDETPADDAFGPPQQEDDLQLLDLATPAARSVELAAPARPPRASEGTIYSESRAGVGLKDSLRWVLVLALVAAAAGAGWYYRDKIVALFSEAAPVSSSENAILLLVETAPKDADIYVDGVLAVTKPIQLPRSSRLFSIRVTASGYYSEVRKVRADKTKTLQVKLRRIRE